MEPIPETRELLEELERAGGGGLSEVVLAMGQRVRAIAPECVGLSLGLVEEGLTLTLVASNEQIAALDAVQYVDDGPCVSSQLRGEVVDARVADLLDEGRWAAFARAGAAAGVASSLSIPIERDGRVVGGVNLYGANPDTFDGRHQELAAALGASASGAITNADLAFSTRLAAARAPRDLGGLADVDVALGVVAEARGVDMATARRLLERAAARAGISLVAAARALINIYGD